MAKREKRENAMWTITKEALVVRIPWKELATRVGVKLRKSQLNEQDVLRLVEEGRKAYRQGKTRVIHSLSELRF